MKWFEGFTIAIVCLLCFGVANLYHKVEGLEQQRYQGYISIDGGGLEPSSNYTLEISGYIDTPPGKKIVDWESKYNELWESYKHTIWHYDAQAENLRKERDNLWEQLEEFRPTDNFTIEIFC